MTADHPATTLEQTGCRNGLRGSGNDSDYQSGVIRTLLLQSAAAVAIRTRPLNELLGACGRTIFNHDEHEAESRSVGCHFARRRCAVPVATPAD